MTNEEKAFLLKDLCARLPYNVKGLINGWEGIIYPHDIEDLHKDLRTIKPYLRPMSSMTEEEKNNLGIILPCSMSFSYSTDGDLIIYTDEEYDSDHYFSKFVEVQDFLNAHHFDYRGLIEKGLAIEAPEDMYKKNQKV